MWSSLLYYLSILKRDGEMKYGEIKLKITQEVYSRLRNVNESPSLFNIKLSIHCKKDALSEVRSFCITFSEILTSS